MSEARPGPPLPRRLGEVRALKYVTAPNAPTYRAIMTVCNDALQRYIIELRPHEIHAALCATGLAIDVADVEVLDAQYLSQLVSWGNLAATADPAGVDRLEDFYRRRLVYHVTDVGEAAHRAVLDVEATVGRSGSLQANMLVKIRDAIAALATADGHDAEAVFRLLHEVHAAFETLTHEANRFMTDLGRLLGDERGEASDVRFATFKEAVLTYVSRFVEELRRLRDDIVAAISAADEVGIDALIATASRSADLPDFEVEGHARGAWASEQQSRWQGLLHWFVGDAHGEATVERLATFAVSAVVSLTRTLGRLNDRRGRPVDRRTDFLTLAGWFAACASDEEAHGLAHVAFGLHSARHLHVAEDDPELTSPRASWWDARPVHVATRLRTHGDTPRQGRAPQAVDFTRERSWLRAKAARERAQVAAAVARFAGRELRLSQLATLAPHEFDLLLDLLDAALTTPVNDVGVRASRTIDGRLRVALRPPSDGATCVIETTAGRLRCVDYAVDVAEVTVGSTVRTVDLATVAT